MYHVLWELTQQAAELTRRRVRVARPGRGHRAGGRLPAVRARAGRRVRAGRVRRQRPGGRVRRGRGSGAAAVRGVRGRAARPARPRWPWSRTSTCAPLPPTGAAGVRRRSPAPAAGARRSPVPADTATCADCLAELLRPGRPPLPLPVHQLHRLRAALHRRHRHPVRPSIHDDGRRSRCAPDCAREYADPADRRFHAQPVCCPACGPALALVDAAGGPLPATRSARRPSCCGPARCSRSRASAATTSPRTPRTSPRSAALRARKHREERPFAVLAADLAAAGTLGAVDPVAAGLLTGRRRPVVLLPRRPGAPLAPSVAPGNREVGVLLPYTPLHHLLAAEVGRPFVLTSGNVSDEPIAYDDADAAPGWPASPTPCCGTTGRSTPGSTTRWSGSCAAGRCRSAAPAATRPSRWCCPWPASAPGARLRRRAEEHVLPAAGPPGGAVPPHRRPGELGDATESYVDGHRALPAAVRHRAGRWSRTTCTRTTCPPRTRRGCAAVELTGVQHHHAHIASCLADNGAPRAGDRAGAGRHRLRPGRHRVGRRGAGRRPARLPAGSGTWSRCRCRAGRPRSASRGGWRRPTCGAGTGLAVERRNAERWDAVGLARRAARVRDLQRRAAVRRGRRGRRASGTSSRTRARRRSSWSSGSTRTSAGGYPARVAGGVLHGTGPGPGGRRGRPRRRRRPASSRPGSTADWPPRSYGWSRTPAPTADCPPWPCPAACCRTRVLHGLLVDGLTARGLRGTHALPGAAERRRHQPRPGRGRRRPRPLTAPVGSRQAPVPDAQSTRGNHPRDDRSPSERLSGAPSAQRSGPSRSDRGTLRVAEGAPVRTGASDRTAYAVGGIRTESTM